MKMKINFINFDTSDGLLSNWSRFHTIISKEKLWNFDQFQTFSDQLAKLRNFVNSQLFRLIRNPSLNDTYLALVCFSVQKCLAGWGGGGGNVPHRTALVEKLEWNPTRPRFTNSTSGRIGCWRFVPRSFAEFSSVNVVGSFLWAEAVCSKTTRLEVPKWWLKKSWKDGSQSYDSQFQVGKCISRNWISNKTINQANRPIGQSHRAVSLVLTELQNPWA